MFNFSVQNSLFDIRYLFPFKNHHGGGDSAIVSQRDVDGFHAHFGGEFGGAAMNAQKRLTRRQTVYLEVFPMHAAPPAGAQRFAGRFFGCDARRELLGVVLEAFGVRDFARREAAPRETFAVAFEITRHTRNFANIYAETDYHWSFEL